MTAHVRQAEDGAYELGAEIDGVFVPFASRPAEAVQTVIDNAKAQEESSAGGEPERRSWI